VFELQVHASGELAGRSSGLVGCPLSFFPFLFVVVFWEREKGFVVAMFVVMCERLGEAESDRRAGAFRGHRHFSKTLSFCPVVFFGWHS
jgi:hypothetical protein